MPKKAKKVVKKRITKAKKKVVKKRLSREEKEKKKEISDIVKIKKEAFDLDQKIRSVEQRISESEISQILQPVKAPVLEKIAEAIETPIGRRPTTQNNLGISEDVDYKQVGTKSDYLSTGERKLEEERNTNYVQRSDYIEPSERTKEEKEMMRNVNLLTPSNQRSSGKKEDGFGFFSPDSESKKYENKKKDYR